MIQHSISAGKGITHHCIYRFSHDVYSHKKVFLKSSEAYIVRGTELTYFTCTKQACITASKSKSILLPLSDHCFTFRIYASWQKGEKSCFRFLTKKPFKDKVQKATLHLASWKRKEIGS